MQMQEIRNLFNEYSTYSTKIKGSEGIRIRAINIDNFENLCLEKDVFTIRQQNSFINAATKTYLNITDNQGMFAEEFEKLSVNLHNIYERLSNAINEDMDPQFIPDSEKSRYQDMVEQMSRAIMTPVNKKVAFLTFKIVEETVKRACLKGQIEKFMPMQSETLRNIKRTINESQTTKEVSMTRTGQQYLNVGITPTKERSPETINRRT